MTTNIKKHVLLNAFTAIAILQAAIVFYTA